jgi:OOP family OmpA-OmpF porin
VQVGDTAFEPYKFTAKDYVQKIDNFLVVFDASTSMSDWYKGRMKLYLAKDIASKMNQTIPEMAYKGGLRTFGQGDCLPKGDTSLIYGMTPFARSDLAGAINKIQCTGGNSPLDDAINAAAPELTKLSGKTAMIVISDGLQMENAPNAAAAIKKAMGDNLCIYTIQIGDSPVGKQLLESVAKAGGCGFAVNADDIASSVGMADFVEKVFLKRAALPEIKDSDGDGVPDDRDKCPGTPKGVRVDANGCPIVASPLDSDGDGVFDDRDQCPGTPRGAKVDERGCWVIKGVWFDFDKAEVKKEYEKELQDVAAVLKANPGLKIVLEGHTCNIGTKEYNQGLSERRAKAVKAYLVKLGVPEQNLTTKGYGLTKPSVPNTSKANRAKNRRVELTPIK